MEKIGLTDGLEMAMDALVGDRLALLCGAGLSKASPSSLPSAAEIAARAKQYYDDAFCPDRDPLPTSLEDQAQFFFDCDNLANVYLRTFVDQDAFAGQPNAGHFAIADFLLVRGIRTAVSTNVDMLIEMAGNELYGHISKGVCRASVANVPQDKSPLLKVHGCWSDQSKTIWAPGQIREEPVRTRIQQCGHWLETRLLDHDLMIVGFWTDWDYLNDVLEKSLGTVQPGRVLVVDPCPTETFEQNAPILFELGKRASLRFCHVQESGADFLDLLRRDFSKIFIRKTLRSGRHAYTEGSGREPEHEWLEPQSKDTYTLWQIRRDLEGCLPNQPSKERNPPDGELMGMFLLQIQSKGAVLEENYWMCAGQRIRVLHAPNRFLHQVEATYEKDTAPAIAPDIIVAIGAETDTLLPSIARGHTEGSIARGADVEWLSYADAKRKLNI